MALTPCSACARHVRALDTTCPFCRAPAPARSVASPSVPRLGRAALLAFGTTLAATACGGGAAEPAPTEETSGGEDASRDPTAPTSQPTSQPGADSGPPDDGGGVVALYGAPAP
jgi:hypothetical protein